MKYIRNTTDFYFPKDTAVSLGKFDGIHRGHEHLLQCLEEKKKMGLDTVVFTFDIPPKWKVGRQAQEKVLTTNEEKMQIFAGRGVDYLLECPFTEEIMHMEPEDFIQMMAERLHIKSLVVGTDFHFGHKKRGDYLLLKKLSEVYGYELQVVEKIQENGRDISSTYIREEIMAGRIEDANRLLGFPYFVQGTVIHGNEIGRTLDVPTANLLPPEEKLLPPYGVYATRTTFLGKTYGGITNVGCKPTIEGTHPAGVETHLFRFYEQMYGAEIKVEFLTALRPEMKFSSLEELKLQMQKDIASGIKIAEAFSV